MKVVEAEDAIRETAAREANNLAQQHPQAPRGPVFQNVGKLNDGPFALEFVQGTYEYLKDKGGEPLIDEFRSYAIDGIKAALEEHADLLVGSIFGYASAGEDYFDRIENATD